MDLVPDHPYIFGFLVIVMWEFTKRLIERDTRRRSDGEPD